MSLGIERIEQEGRKGGSQSRLPFRSSALPVLSLSLLLAFTVSPARAADAGSPADAGAPIPAVIPPTPLDAGAPVESVNGCVESIPTGAQRPVIIDSFPERGFSGYAVTLSVTVEHGKVTRWRDYLDPVAIFDAAGWPEVPPA